jgi:cyclopropane-fatty-acyl-phospholipid synthase
MTGSVRPVGRRTRPAASPRDRGSRKVIFGLLRRIDGGRITVVDDHGHATFGPTGAELSVTVTVHATATYTDIISRGSVGMGESYLDGWWDCDDLTTLVRILARNLPRLDRLRNGVDRAVSPITDLVRRLRPEDPHRDRLNISAHYDLGNEFFALFLDDSMMYSSGWFSDPADTLTTASRAKLDRICSHLDLGPDDHVVEIGTGWGGFAVHAAREYGCRVTTTTISAEQEAYARARVEREGLEHLVTVLGLDYRELTGTYDALVSIEMIEAVDWREYDRFFETCSRLLRDDGRMALQAIVLPDQRFERAKTTQDFIKRFVFPGGCLPSVESILRSTTARTDLALTRLDDMGHHYALTLARWRERLFKHEAELDDLGVDEAFLRLWDFYFAYCEGAFAERYVSVVQAVFVRPGWRHGSERGTER